MTDHQMPEMTGQELCQRLRDSDAYTDTPIMVITGEVPELELQHLRTTLDITTTLLKPFSPQEVVRAVDECLISH